MRILICGIDGYLGWSLALHLGKLGHEVYGIDNFSRRKNVEEVGSWSATPILDIAGRLKAAKKIHGIDISFQKGDLTNYSQISRIVQKSRPDAIVHLGEQPSAPFSMIDREHAVDTQYNNVIGTLNLLFAAKEFARQSHLVKLGTMGEYGTPGVDIPEGFFEVEFRGRKAKMPFPRQAGSFYHWSKVHDSGNTMFACKLWGLRSTDIMQGVVYGTRTDEITDDRLFTRFDFDESFGTVINRYCAQSVIGYPLSPYGEGRQKRGFIALIDSIQCLTIACMNPPDQGTYRVFNQLDEVYSILELAEVVSKAAKNKGLKAEIKPVSNPRIEMQDHYYKVDSLELRKLGFKPTRRLSEEVGLMLDDLLRFKNRIMAKKSSISPKTKWQN